MVSGVLPAAADAIEDRGGRTGRVEAVSTIWLPNRASWSTWRNRLVGRLGSGQEMQAGV